MVDIKIIDQKEETITNEQRMKQLHEYLSVIVDRLRNETLLIRGNLSRGWCDWDGYEVGYIRATETKESWLYRCGLSKHQYLLRPGCIVTVFPKNHPGETLIEINRKYVPDELIEKVKAIVQKEGEKIVQWRGNSKLTIKIEGVYIAPKAHHELDIVKNAMADLVYVFRCFVVRVCQKIARRKAINTNVFNKNGFAYTASFTRVVELAEDLKSRLQNCSKIKGVEEYAIQGLKQFEKSQTKLNALIKLLDEKLNVKELTYVKYVQAAEKVYISIIDNLKFASSLMISVNSINEDSCLINDQLKRVDELLSQNEEALNQMDQATAAVAGMPLDKGGALADFETAQKELSDLVIFQKRKLNYA